MTRQFDAHWNRFAEGQPGPPFLVNLQSDHFNVGPTVVAAPLWPITSGSGPAPSPVSVRLWFQGREYWLVLTDMAYMRVSALGPVAGTIAAERDRIIRGIDMLFTGI